MKKETLLKQKIDETRKCPNDFSCLCSPIGDKRGRCRIEFSAGDHSLFLKGKNPWLCPYKLPWGMGAICRCPTCNALHRHPFEGVVNGGFMIINAHDVLIGASEWIEAIAGLPAGEAVGARLMSVFPVEDFSAFMLLYQEAIRNKESMWYEHIPLTTSAGQRINVSGWLIPQYIGNDLQRVVCTVEESSLQKHAGSD
jgi:hypothetical protein